MTPTEDTRTQQLSLQVAKTVFLHPANGLVFSRDPIRLADARRAGLTLLVLYGLTYQGLPAKHWELHPLDAPAPLESFLTRAWRAATWLKGPPDKLEVSEALFGAVLAIPAIRILAPLRQPP